MFLVAIRFDHYSPKDSEPGIKEYVIADSMERVIAYVDEEYLYHKLSRVNDENEDEDDQLFLSPDEDWINSNPGKLDEARSLGLEVDEYNGVTGRSDKMILWYGGDDCGDVSDAYYGVTHYNWRDAQQISESIANELLQLKIAKDLRTWVPS